jgi:hypothetical protein
MKLRYALFAAILALSSWHIAEAQDAAPTAIDQHEIEEKDGAAPVGRFAVLQMVTAQHNEFMNALQTPGQTAILPTIYHIKPGQRVESFAFIAGCKPDKKRKCRLLGELRVTNPKGVTRVIEQGVAINVSSKNSQTSWLTPNRPFPVTIGNEEMEGDYKFTLTITDTVANISRHSTKSVHVSPQHNSLEDERAVAGTDQSAARSIIGKPGHRFAIRHFITDNGRQFVRMWRVAEDISGYPLIDTITQGGTAESIFAFTGCTANVRDACYILVDIKLTYPDGNVVYLRKELNAFVDKAPPKRRWTLSDHSVVVSPPAGAPPGDYVVTIAVTDAHAGVTRRDSQTLRVQPLQ